MRAEWSFQILILMLGTKEYILWQAVINEMNELIFFPFAAKVDFRFS